MQALQCIWYCLAQLGAFCHRQCRLHLVQGCKCRLLLSGLQPMVYCNSCLSCCSQLQQASEPPLLACRAAHRCSALRQRAHGRLGRLVICQDCCCCCMDCCGGGCPPASAGHRVHCYEIRPRRYRKGRQSELSAELAVGCRRCPACAWGARRHTPRHPMTCPAITAPTMLDMSWRTGFAIRLQEINSRLTLHIAQQAYAWSRICIPNITLLNCSPSSILLILPLLFHKIA